MNDLWLAIAIVAYVANIVGWGIWFAMAVI
jgi:hypothetical protein